MISSRLQMIFTHDELKRITVEEFHEKKTQIQVDVHGMKCCQAKRFINNIINIARCAFQLIIIHGYNHGTAIKDMLFENFSNTHIAKQYADPFNQGVTHMIILK